MDPRFNDIFTSPENDIFKVVFFPDRIYHARYLNATRSRRYRYNVQEVRGKLVKCQHCQTMFRVPDAKRQDAVGAGAAAAKK